MFDRLIDCVARYLSSLLFCRHWRLSSRTWWRWTTDTSWRYPALPDAAPQPDWWTIAPANTAHWVCMNPWRWNCALSARMAFNWQISVHSLSTYVYKKYQRSTNQSINSRRTSFNCCYSLSKSINRSIEAYIDRQYTNYKVCVTNYKVCVCELVSRKIYHFSDGNVWGSKSQVSCSQFRYFVNYFVIILLSCTW